MASGSGPALLDMHRVSVMRGDRVVLHDLDLKIGVGEHVAILGPNGCGKSTLIKTIARALYPLARPESRMSILGRERWDVFQLRSALGIVSADLMTHCTQEITAREVVLSGFFSSVGIWPHHHVTPAMEEKADEILALLDASRLAGTLMTGMSSGEARRALIGRALVHHPKALLLDEPSTSLDLLAQHELRRILRRLAETEIGIVMITHQLSDVIPEIERVVMMRGGRIVADGAKEDLLTAEALERLFGLPVRLEKQDGYYHLW